MQGECSAQSGGLSLRENGIDLQSHFYGTTGPSGSCLLEADCRALLWLDGAHLSIRRPLSKALVALAACRMNNKLSGSWLAMGSQRRAPTSGLKSKSEEFNCNCVFPLLLTFTTHACDGAMKSFKSASLTAPENCAISSYCLTDCEAQLSHHCVLYTHRLC